MKRAAALPMILILALGPACAPAPTPAPRERGAPLLQGLGDHHHAITTRDPLAQRYFDQGLVLAFGFNHAEAERSFREAALVDPSCSMCWWGAALVLGPNINVQMQADAVPRAYEAAQTALELSSGATAAERGYIKALAARYAPEATEDRSDLDQAYADAMRELARRLPDDLDAQVLFAEAAMDVHPWDYWTRDGEPRPWTPEILKTLEGVLARDPEHIGAMHFYIHAVEASKHPERAERYADRLGDLVPGAGHLVHMPSHIYIRIGRYHDAAEVNIRAGAVDDEYVAQCHAQGVYPLAYVPHNRHFLWAAAVMEGNRGLAVQAAGQTDERTDRTFWCEPGLEALQHYALLPLYTRIRFGLWDEVLATPAPLEHQLYPTGVWHYARGMAFLSKGRLDEAQAEREALAAAAADPAIEPIFIWDINRARDLLRIAGEVLAGEIAARRGETEAAIAHLRRGAEMEDALRYDEPEDWNEPVRLHLGAVLLDAGRAAEAETAYREDLREHPENGWALFGLARSLEAQGRDEEAAAARARFDKAWKYADVTLTSSRIL